MPQGVLLLVCSYSRAFQMFQDAALLHGFQPVACFTLQDAELAIAERDDIAAIVCSEHVLDGSYHPLLSSLAKSGRTAPVFVIFNSDPVQRAEAQTQGVAACSSRPTTPAEANALVSAIVSRL